MRALAAKDYGAAIERVAAIGLSSGVIYDALHREDAVGMRERKNTCCNHESL